MKYEFKTDFNRITMNLRNIVNQAISDYIQEVKAPSKLLDASFHLIKSGGKRIRPIILIEITELLGGSVEEAVPAGISVEFLHNFTLIHDDIMDRDEFRRGVKTTHVLYGDSMALLAGDFLFSIVFNILSKSYDNEKTKKLVKVFSWASMEICKGQAMDIEPDMYIKSVEDYLEMIYLKTASLIEASAVAGAIVADAYEYSEVIKSFGRKIGIAFQIADDLLGILGDPKKTGKPVGNDIRNGKKTLPVLYTFEHADKEQLAEFKRVFGSSKASDEEINHVVDIIKSVGAIDYSRDYMYKLADEAIQLLKRFPSSEARDYLEDLVRFIVYREV